MKRLATLCAAAVVACTAGVAMPSPVWAGKVFITGHDPDFHALSSPGAQNLLQIGLDFVTNGTTNSVTEKFLFVTARPDDLGGVPAGHRDPVAAGLTPLSLVEGTHFDVAHAGPAVGPTLDLSTVDFNNYTAIAVASSFGGLLRRAELDGLIARKDEIKAFVNAGGGLFASAECDVSFATSCGADLINPAGGLFGFLPLTATSVPPLAPFMVQAFGTGLGLVDADVQDPTHNSFSDAAGLNIVDTDANGVPTTLAGDVLIGDGGFVQLLKEITSGPDEDADGEIDIAIQILQLTSTAYDWELTYTPAESDPENVVVIDTVPAEWDVTFIDDEAVPDTNTAPKGPADTGMGLGCGESEAGLGNGDKVDLARGGKSGKECSSATTITWDLSPSEPVQTLKVDVTTRQSPSGKLKFKPTSCGKLTLNDGAQAFEADAEGNLVLRVGGVPGGDIDPINGEPVPVGEPSNSLMLVALDDLNGGGLVGDGTGDEDGDTLEDADEAFNIGTDPCLADTDADGEDDNLDNCPLAANPNQTDDDGDGVGNVCDLCLGTDAPGEINANGCDLDDVENGPGSD